MPIIRMMKGDMHSFIKAHILIAESERIIALDLTTMLSRLGYTSIENAYSMAEALSMIRAKKPDVVILDEMMGDQDDRGELGRAIVTQFSIPVMLLSTAMKGSRRSVRTGNLRVVHKPFGEKEIDSSLRSILHKARIAS